MKRKTSALGMRRCRGATPLSNPADAIAHAVNALLRKRVEEGCEQAWSELEDVFGVATLFPSDDAASVRARAATRALIDDVTSELTKLTVAALLLPSTTSPSQPPRRLRLVRVRTNSNGHTRSNGHNRVGSS